MANDPVAFRLIVGIANEGERIDSFVARALLGRFSREEIKESLKKGLVFLNGQSAAPKKIVSEGDVVTGTIHSDKTSFLQPEDIPVKVVYEDTSLLVIDKPAGMVVHPGAGNKKGTLVNALLGRGAALSETGGPERPGIVHRLDKETSGLLVVPKENGRVEFEEGHVAEPIGRHPKVRQKMAVSHLPRAKDAESIYRVLKRFPHTTLIEVKLLTGRTHQIRVHMAHLGYPVVGDALYGKVPERSSNRHALHAAKLEFVHPKSGKIMTFESEWPEDFKAIVEAHKEPESPKE